MGRQRRTCGTNNGEDLYETKVGYPMGGCRDENEIRKRERGAPALLPAPL